MLAAVLLMNAVALEAPALSADYPPPQFPASIAGMEHTLRNSRIMATGAAAGYSVDISTRAVSRLFYRSVYASSNGIASGWNGNIGNCVAGDTNADFKDGVLRRINWFRAMAGVPAAVSFDSSFSSKAQQAAMMFAANKALSHSPPTNWICYNSVGGDAAGHSNIALGNFGPNAISNGYMSDGGGNNAAVGHRRWVLYPQTQFMGTGDVDGAISGTSTNSLWVFDANMWGTRPAVRDDFVSWPPKGYVPYNTVYARWSFSYPSADFSAATVTMTQNGTVMSTTLEALANGYGENTLVWVPQGHSDGSGWTKPAADTPYTVTVGNVKVGGTTRSFTYTVTVYDPDQTGSGEVTPSISGSLSPKVGVASHYTFDAVPGATAYQWRQLALSPYSLSDGAESGSGNFNVVSTGGYPVVQGDAVAAGSASFHLAHVQANDQTLTLKQPVYLDAGASLSFSSRLGYAGTGQVASAELSFDDGATWVPVWSQAGSGSSGEGSFSTRTASLSSYAGRTAMLRFHYAFTGGSYYYQSSKGVGWYIDNIALSGVEAAATGSTAATSGTGFDLTAAKAGSLLLQVRPGMYGYYSDWSPAKKVTAASTNVMSDADRLMNWAERQYPQYFSPAAQTQQIGDYAARAYASGIYLGVANGQVYVYGPPFGPQILPVGPISGYLAGCGC